MILPRLSDGDGKTFSMTEIWKKNNFFLHKIQYFYNILLFFDLSDTSLLNLPNMVDHLGTDIRKQKDSDPTEEKDFKGKIVLFLFY